ncbi:MAG: YggS family pyridoxal phosphate-dependent enzyme [Acidimicrobiales bacterium]|jgi:pyridoxal phosphate enzyme (YggS family)
MSPLSDQIASRAAAARERIAQAGGDVELVRIVAVTKGFGPEHVAAAFAAGLRDFGENYADELVKKWTTVGRDATWHFLGAVQRNKVGRLAPYVDYWQALTRAVEGQAILRHRAEVDLEGLEPPAMFVEVETTGQSGRGGCLPEQVPLVVSALRELGCRVEGLMTVAPQGDPGRARTAFERVARLRGELGLKELSMGMSEDLEQAVAAGATMVRLGTALFGPRPQRRRL